MWNNSIDIFIDGISTKTVGIEDFFIHLILHMAVHTKYYGFGIRKIYDLSLFINDNYEKIDWIQLKKRIFSYGFLKYTQGIMMIINKYFKVIIPNSFFYGNIGEQSIDIFIDNIMSSGVHGKKI